MEEWKGKRGAKVLTSSDPSNTLGGKTFRMFGHPTFGHDRDAVHGATAQGGHTLRDAMPLDSERAARCLRMRQRDLDLERLFGILTIPKNSCDTFSSSAF